MSEKQIVERELYILVKYLHPEFSQLQVVQKVNQLSWYINEEEGKMLVEGAGMNQVVGWNGNNIYSID